MAAGHTFFPVLRVRSAHAEASGAIPVLFSQLQASLRGLGKLLIPIFFRAIISQFFLRWSSGSVSILNPNHDSDLRELGPALWHQVA